MAQLVGHDVATDVGEADRIVVSVTDRDETFANLWKDIAKETKLPSDKAIIKSPSISAKPEGGPTSAPCPSSVA